VQAWDNGLSPDTGLIRTGLAWFLLSCPNTGLIRTDLAGFLSFLSEYGAHSDRSCLNFAFSVRIRGLFGQILLSYCLFCPNTRLIRTDLAWLLPFLSEYEAYSDRSCLVFAFSVRIRGSFGQILLSYCLFCPNTRLIRTNLA
jgi:hypothetical protein